MNSKIFQAFGDELVKISMFNTLKSGFMNSLREGWHGTKANPTPLWSKGLTVASTIPMIPGAVAKDDPSGQGKTRGERVADVVGSTAGGLVGSARAMRAMPHSKYLGPIGGGIVGSVLGSRILSAPFKPFRQPQPNQVMQQQQPAQISGGVA